MRNVSAGTQGKAGGSVGETRAWGTRWTLRPLRCGDVQPSLAGGAVSGASGGIGSRHSDTRHQTPVRYLPSQLMYCMFGSLSDAFSDNISFRTTAGNLSRLPPVFIGKRVILPVGVAVHLHMYPPSPLRKHGLV